MNNIALREFGPPEDIWWIREGPEELNNILKSCRSRVNIIRQEPRPLIHYNTDNSKFQNLSKRYSISDFIIKEIVTLIQVFNFVEWRELKLDNDSESVVSDPNKFLFDILWEVKLENINEIIWDLDLFFKKISKTSIIREMYNSWVKESEIRYGLFRFISLFDMKLDDFSNLKVFLDFFGGSILLIYY